ncbi:MAG: ATP-binding protein [Candidatus Latescibacterota bacterium]
MPPGQGVLRRYRFGLEAKFVVLATAVILAASLVGNRLVFAYVRDQLFDKARRQAVVLAESMARSFLHALIYEELGLVEEAGLLEQHIEDVVGRPDMAVRFVKVVNPRGVVIAHSDYRWYGRVDPAVAGRYGSDLQDTRVVERRHGGEPVLEVASPLRIASRSWGVLVLAVSLVPVERELGAFATRLSLLTVAAVLVSVPLAFLVARALARPVKRLALAMSRVGPDLASDLRVDRGDEIGLLQSSFLDMLGRLRQAQQEQEQTRQAMLRAEKLASVGALASGVAHEVNNPLGGIRNCLAQLEAHPEDQERRQEYMGLMRRALEHIERVVSGLLGFSRRRELEVAPVSLEQVIRGTLALAEYRLDSSRIERRVEVEPELPTVLGDRHQLEQVLVNLVLNAADSMEGGGRLTIRAYRQGQWVRVCVQDSGPGVPPGLGERVFDPFFSTKEVGRGTGLGLTVSLSIVREHGGDLSYVNVPGGGAAFTVALPAQRGDGVPQEARIP